MRKFITHKYPLLFLSKNIYIEEKKKNKSLFLFH